MKRRTHRRLFFPLGILSLAILPLLGFQKIADTYKERTKQEHVMEVCIFDSSLFALRHQSFEDLVLKRNYKQFTLSADSSRNEIVLNEARVFLDNIKSARDTLKGIQITVNDFTSYGDYIKTLNICAEKWPNVSWNYNNKIRACYAYVDTVGRYQRMIERQQANADNRMY